MEKVVCRFFAKIGGLAIFEDIEVYMKFYILAFSALLLTVIFGCGEASPKSVVIYFSQTGTTKKIAEEIRENAGADLAELRMENPYPSTYGCMISAYRIGTRNKELAKTFERENGFVEIRDGLSRLFDYVRDVLPFCMYDRGGLQVAARELKRLVPYANVVESYGIAHKRISKSANDRGILTTGDCDFGWPYINCVGGGHVKSFSRSMHCISFLGSLKAS